MFKMFQNADLPSSTALCMDLGEADPKTMVLRFEARHSQFRVRILTVSSFLWRGPDRDAL